MNNLHDLGASKEAQFVEIQTVEITKGLKGSHF